MADCARSTKGPMVRSTSSPAAVMDVAALPATTIDYCGSRRAKTTLASGEKGGGPGRFGPGPPSWRINSRRSYRRRAASRPDDVCTGELIVPALFLAIPENPEETDKNDRPADE